MFWAACKNSLLGCAKGHVHRLSVKSAVRCHFTQISLKTRIIHTCPPSSDVNLHRGTHVTSSVLCRSKLHEHHYSLHEQLFNSRLLTSAFSSPASNGFSTKASRKEVSQQDQRETDAEKCSSSPPNNEGHFQFKELVRESFKFIYIYI